MQNLPLWVNLRWTSIPFSGGGEVEINTPDCFMLHIFMLDITTVLKGRLNLYADSFMQNRYMP